MTVKKRCVKTVRSISRRGKTTTGHAGLILPSGPAKCGGVAGGLLKRHLAAGYKSIALRKMKKKKGPMLKTRPGLIRDAPLVGK